MQFSNVGKSCFKEAGLERTQGINQDVQDLQTMVYRKISTKDSWKLFVQKKVQTNKTHKPATEGIFKKNSKL